MKTISFIFHQRAAYAVNWQSLMDSASHHHFVMVTTSDCLDKITDLDITLFSGVITVNTFSFEELLEKVGSYLSTHYTNSDQIRFAVLSEFTMTVAAKLRDHLSQSMTVLGPGSVEMAYFRDKNAMKQLLGPQGVRIPNYTLFDSNTYLNEPEPYLQSLAESLDFPMFVKPIDSGGSIGTALIRNRDELRAWCKQAAENPSQQYEIDEFIDGDLFHCDTIIRHGKAEMTFVNRYLHPNADARSGKALTTMTMDPDSPDYQALKSFTEQTLTCFPTIPDGFTHMEVFKNRKGELIFLEIAARPPGAKAPEVFKIRSGGIDMRWLHLRLNLGLPIDSALSHLADRHNWGPYAAMFQLLAPENDSVITMITDPKLASEYHCDHTYQVGDELKPNQSLLDTVYSCVFWNDDYASFVKDFFALDSQQVIQFEAMEYIQAESFFPPSIFNVVSHARYYLSALGESIGQYLLKQVEETVRECPSYFPPNNPYYWRGGTTSTFFNGNGAEFCNATVPLLPSFKP